jgi:hypothetical protein
LRLNGRREPEMAPASVAVFGLPWSAPRHGEIVQAYARRVTPIRFIRLLAGESRPKEPAPARHSTEMARFSPLSVRADFLDSSRPQLTVRIDPVQPERAR